MKRQAFQYDLPPDRVANFPLEDRTSARLLVCSIQDPGLVAHHRIHDLPELLEVGDVLVLNETRVLPYRLVGRRQTGGAIECLILRRDGNRGEGFLRPAARLSNGEVLVMEGGALSLTITEQLGSGKHRLTLATPSGEELEAVLDAVGRAPLPPYLKRRGDEENVALDRSRYQTVFARKPGAVAAPTAGLHLTEDLLRALAERGVDHVRVTLHVGEGTFEPIRSEEIEEHEMHAEWYELAAGAKRRLDEAKARGGRVICIGTTSARVMETCWDSVASELVAGTGETNLYLYPGKGPRYLDGLLTNFHLPESTLLLLVASILGRERTLQLYETAVEEEYRFYSFGDAMLILP